MKLNIQKFSGGSYDYNYNVIYTCYVGRMYDYELDEMMKDLVKLLHDLEWWQSCDESEEGYRNTVKQFKDKWFIETRENRLKEMIEIKIKETKDYLLKVIGDKE